MTAIGTKFTVDELYIPLNAIETAGGHVLYPPTKIPWRLFDLTGVITVGKSGYFPKPLQRHPLPIGLSSIKLSPIQ